MLFESYMHSDSLFVTLTYDEDHVPYVERGSSRQTLRPSDCTLFLKRLRERLARKDNDRKVRYFLSGEYGDTLGRPHYHAILFGCSLADAPEIMAAWQNGSVHCAPANTNRIRYTAKYVQKKIINQAEPDYPDGRLSEFARMSRMPGLGSAFLTSMAKGIKRQADNPKVSLAGLARVDGRKYPIDRYGRNLLQSTLVDLGVPWRDAERLVKNPCRKGDSEDGVHAAEKAERKVVRQNKYRRSMESRQKVYRPGCTGVH